MSVLGRVLTRTLPYVPKQIAAIFARRYIAGETLEEGLRVATDLNHQGFRTTMDLLGEDTARPEQAEQALDDYRRVLEGIQKNDIDGNISVKPTQFGLRIDSELCGRLLRELAAEAHRLGHFVRVEMEDSSTTNRTLTLFRKLRKDFDNVGIVVQSCLFRSANDLEAIQDLSPNVRMVKGVYVEPATIAFQDRQRIRDEYVALSETLIRGGSFVAFATHDEYLVERAVELIRKYELGKSAYEFQMLLGVREQLRSEILSAGHPIRVYVPFGSDWYPYSMRRLRENPRIATYVFKAMLGRD
jgi:proline dehydrogenase